MMSMRLRWLVVALGVSMGLGLAAGASAQTAVPATAGSTAPAAAASSGAPAESNTGPIKVLIRYPTMHGNDVVFEAGGNLWETTLKGGVAKQLTSDSGFDMAPHFSPDGRWIAFTGWYQGNTDVYVIPATGGPAKRLTWHSINSKMGNGQLKPSLDNIVMGWTPNSRDVVFLSRRNSFNVQPMHAYTVPVTGGLPKQLPLPWTGPLSFNANGTEVAYNKLSRVLRPFHRKHYFGGQAQKIWIYNFDTHKIHQITHWKGASVWPMWRGNTIYFTSDRGAHGVQNLWSYSLKQKHFTQLTHFPTYDIDWPTLGNDGIALSDGGDLYVYLFRDHKLHKINVRVPTNGIKAMPHWVDAAKHVHAADIAPSGKLAVFSASGALFTVPAKFGSTRTLTQDPAADERDPAWSPNGKQLAFIFAKDSNDQIAIRPATGGPMRFLTHGSKLSYQGPITWSPNGDWISYVDSHQTLWLQNVKTGQRVDVTTDPSSRFTFMDLAWAPNSQWIAFSKTLPDRMSGLFLYDLADESLHQVSKGKFNDYDPSFSDNGKYLFFASNRLSNPAVGEFDSNEVAGLDSSGLYALTLAASTPSPVAPREPKATPKSHHKNGKKKKHQHPQTGPIAIDLNDMMARAVQLPVPAANIGQIIASHGVVYYSTMPNQTPTGGLPGEQPTLSAYDIAKRKQKTLVKGIGGSFAVSADGSTILYEHKGKWVLRPAEFKTKEKTETLNLAHVRRWIEPHAQWDTAFGEAWRDVNNYFFEPALVKQHWVTFGDRYRRLLPYAASRDDVNWLIANMIGSFGESHMYVFGGNKGWKSPASTTADLGANFKLDKASGRYRIARIYQGNNTIPGYRAPLAQPGLKVKTGDYLLAINGQSLKAPMSPYELLNGTYGTTVRLRLANDASGTGAWTIKVRPIANGMKLRLLAWIRHNRALVNKLSDGKIGYVYLNDFESTGMHEFLRQYYSQMRKQGIIFDDRWNLGGANVIEENIIDRIARKPAAMYTTRRGWDGVAPHAFYGYMALVFNRGSASNGDIFPYMFKQDHLGPIIGSRSWGGVRGYDGGFRLFGDGHLTVSDIGMYDLKSHWVVENIGVEPNVKVHDEPGQLAHGYDAQLETAVKMLMKKIKASPRPIPAPPAWTPAFPPQPAYPKCTDTLSRETCG